MWCSRPLVLLQVCAGQGSHEEGWCDLTPCAPPQVVLRGPPHTHRRHSRGVRLRGIGSPLFNTSLSSSSSSHSALPFFLLSDTFHLIEIQRFPTICDLVQL